MAASTMQRADVTEPGTRGWLQRPEEGREEEGDGIRGQSPGESELCCGMRSTLWSLVAFLYLPQEMTRKVAIPGWREGMERMRLFPKVHTQWM